MDYSYYNTQAQAQPYHFNQFPPTPAHSYDNHDEHSADQTDFFQSANGFPGFDGSYQFDTNAYLPQETPQQPQQQRSPPLSNHRQSNSFEPQNGSLNGSHTGSIKQDYDLQDAQDLNGNNSSGDEGRESLTPAQQRRKVQNRAAQRAFRERKERHVKDLETKLNSLSQHSTTLLSDNERLKRELQRLATQNEILRATSQPMTAGGGPAHHHQHHHRSPSPVHGPQTYSPTDFATATGIELHGRPMSYEDFGGDDGQRLLAAGATWDLIQSHELFKRGMVDVSDVCRRLKGRAACDGRGPAFKEAEVMKAIEESCLSGSDELI